MSLIIFLPFFFFSRLSFSFCVIATLSLNFCLTKFFLANISTSYQLDIFPLSLKCCDKAVIFYALFSLFTSVWCSLILFSIVLLISPIYFLQKEQATMYRTPHVLQLLKGFVHNFDFRDKDLVNITFKPYLLATRLSCSAIPFSYGIKRFGASATFLSAIR